MTGAYVRIERNGKWMSVEIDHLTPEELDAYAKEHPDKGWQWVKMLVQFMQEIPVVEK